LDFKNNSASIGKAAHQNRAFFVPNNLIIAAGKFPLTSGGRYRINKLAKNPTSKIAIRAIEKKDVSFKVRGCFRSERLRIAILAR
jgi:hypothetical protein